MRSNAKGAYERAQHRWHIGAMYIARRMGRGAARALQVAGLMREFANRAEFDAAGCLVTFIGLDLLALLAGTNEKTIRRAIADLETAGVVKIQHRFEKSNLYYLTTPPEAEDHLQRCDILREKRRQALQKRRSQVSRSVGHIRAATVPKCPTNSDYNSEGGTLSLRDTIFANRVCSEDQQEKRVGEEERGRNGGEAETYRIARESFGGESGASVVSMAIQKGGMSPAEIRQIMAEEIDAGNIGDAQALAYALSPGVWSRW